jgi:hypothetical protein
MKIKIYYDGAYYYKNDVLKIIEVTNPDSGGKASLYLAASWKNEMPYYVLLNDLNQPDGFLAIHKIFSPGFIAHLALTNNCFAPLLNAIAEIHQDGNELKQETFTLLVYYFLTENAVSASFIEHWLISAGYNAAFASALTIAVYLARTERTECINVFDGEQSGNLSQTDNLPNLLNIPSKEKYFQSIYPQSHNCLVYDDFAAYELISYGNDLTILNCKDIPETYFLVEDHHHIILGMSVKLCEALALCEYSATLFYEFILEKCTYAETTYFGLGHFLQKFSIELDNRLQNKNLKFSIRALDIHHNVCSFRLKEGISLFLSQDADMEFLPIFLDIEKS